MSQTELAFQVRELRSRGLTSKQIARTLGVRRAEVEPIIRANARERAFPDTLPFYRAWVSPGSRILNSARWSALAADEGRYVEFTLGFCLG